MRYGLPFMGSKNRIAKDIFEILPKGERFVDLFGGGGAMTHYALENNKYNKVLYNELEPITVEYLKRAIYGDFDYRWVSREEFYEKKDKDPIIKYVWSFGNDGKHYLYGKTIEHIKKAGHELVVNGTISKELEKLDIEKILALDGIHERRLELRKQIKVYKGELQSLESLEMLQSLQRLQSLESLERLESLQKLQSLEIKRGSYKDYEYRPGDVVYCDPPYEPIENRVPKYYERRFNNKEFYDWVFSRDYQVFFSSYEISDNRFYKKKVKEVARIMSSASSHKDTEYLYSNKPFK